MRLLFWNTNRNANINRYIAGIAISYDIDVIILAEYQGDDAELLDILFSEGKYFTWCNTIGCDRIKICSRCKNIAPGLQDKYYSIQVVNNNMVLASMHLMSDLHGDNEDRRQQRMRIAIHDIHDTETIIGSRSTIIIGDLNESPYDKGCLSADGFHGLPMLSKDDKRERVVDGVSYSKYYNPMWNLLGDMDYPPGTYYRSSSELYTPMWYMIDQIIISADLMNVFNKKELRIITYYGNVSLFDSRLHPNKTISDHFPIMCEILDGINDNGEE